MSGGKKQSRIGIILAPLITVSLLMNGCSSMHVLGSGAATPLSSVVEPGDHLRVTTYGNEVIQLVVDSVDLDSISGSGRVVLREQILLLEIKKPSPGRTVALVVGLAVVGLGAIAHGGAIAPVTW